MLDTVAIWYPTMSWLQDNSAAIQAVATLVLVAVTIIYVYFTRSLANQAKEQAEAAMTQADAAKESRRRAEADRRYSCLLQAQLALGMQLDKLLNIQHGYLDLHREEPDRHMRLEPLCMSMIDLRIDFSALVFIAEVDDGFAVLQTMYLAEQGYITATTALAESNSRIEKRPPAGADSKGTVDSEAGETAVCDSTAATDLRQFIDGFYRSVDEAVDSMRGAIEDLTSVARRLYPNRKAHHFDPLPKP